MTALRPGRWLMHCGLVLLPLMAAVVIEKRAPGVGAGTPGAASLVAMAQYHWIWLAVTLAVGLRVGWHTAIDRPLYQPPKDDDAP